MGTRGPFPGAKHGQVVMLTTHPHLVSRSKMNRSYTPLPASTTMAHSGTALICFIHFYSCNTLRPKWKFIKPHLQPKGHVHATIFLNTFKVFWIFLFVICGLNFHLTHVLTSFEAHPPSYPTGTGGPSLGVNRSQGATLTNHSHLVLRSRMNMSYTSSPPWRLHGGSGTLYFVV
jgi:hypothetical protein